MARETQRHGRGEKTVHRCGQLAAALLLPLMAASTATITTTARAQVVAGTAVYVRKDSDQTTVIAPRWHVGAPVTETTHLDFVYTVDVWTSASIDIRTSASKPITEQRDEMDTSVSQELGNLTLTGSYRYSHEPDYVSHGGTVGASYAFADKAATLDLRLAGAFDQVGRAGDPHFDRPVQNLSARLGFTQVLDTKTFAQVVYEVMNAHGYNSSPYRFIGVDTTNGLCGTTAIYCVPESNPNERLRHAVALNIRRALGDKFSLGLGYRFYLDSWQVMSHTVLAELAFNPVPELLFALRYRFYTQGSAEQYSSTYDVADTTSPKFYTNDKELSTFISHRIALDIERDFELDARGHRLNVILSAAPSLFKYSNYAPLSQITAIEITLATVLQL
jgi:hypothetical protein